jgi:hypothetical protein
VTRSKSKEGAPPRWRSTASPEETISSEKDGLIG